MPLGAAAAPAAAVPAAAVGPGDSGVTGADVAAAAAAAAAAAPAGVPVRTSLDMPSAVAVSVFFLRCLTRFPTVIREDFLPPAPAGLIRLPRWRMVVEEADS